MRTFLALLLCAASAAAAPVPKRPPPDPFGRGYFGILPADETRLIVAEDPEPDTPAGRAGVRAGDVLVRVGTCTPGTFTDLRKYIADLRPGTRVTVAVRRAGAERTLTVEVGSRPADVTARRFPLPDPNDPDR